MSVGQSRSEKIFEYVRTIYNHQKQGFEEKHQRKLGSLNILPSCRRKKQKERYKKRRWRRRRKSDIEEKPPEDTTIVMNLTGEDLSMEEKTLLSKGLSFCPTPTQLDENQLLDDLESFFRRLCLKEFFLDPDEEEYEEEEEEERNIFCFPSKWMPPKGRDAVLETYVKGMRRETLRQLQHLRTKRVKNNLSPPELQALKTLRWRQDIVIKPADKGSAVVVLKKNDYIKEAERQLGNEDHYQKIEKDPTPFYTAEIKKVVAKMREILYRYLKEGIDI